MSSGLTNKTLKGLSWSFIDLIAKQGIQFLTLVLLARLLVPEHFGLIGMVMVFVALSHTLIDSGFGQALIREETLERIDYNTAFMYNFVFSALLAAAIFFSAPLISRFYGEEQLVPILQVISLAVMFQAFAIVPRTMLTRSVDFKTQSKVSITASVTSGALAVGAALLGFGVWSLVARIVFDKLITSAMLMWVNRWLPNLAFSGPRFRKLFRFGSRLMVSNLINTAYENSYYVLIGRMYTPQMLGYYANAVEFRDGFQASITMSIQRVTYPVLSSIQSDRERLSYGFRKVMNLTAFLFFPMMTGLAAIAPEFIPLLLGPQWIPAVLYFQLLCIAAMLYPVHAINLNILKVKNRSDLFLKIELLKTIVSVLLLIGAVLLDAGVTGFIVAAIIGMHAGLFFNTYYSGIEIDYGTAAQIRDLSTPYVLSFLMGALVIALGAWLSGPLLLVMISKIAAGALLYFLLNLAVRSKNQAEVLRMIRSMF
ncbi:lipopolysaccharide biosynthesis protein [Salisediminibacterium halotolerans]|uniref:Membrane protein involved in the export of O-antigen and teichoic acid n=1 Tax=Salisediminibacterium halotolerans TaxID=517425 RepID=A0A1H9QI32_9BACI|nr:lipopolysaccharide biosynthesis protein [Salisediminibacterium haloalkalitolerans]SER60122.1 Membrane protein involved in the export of O-antigen and teichoic acid [Salisediminibacterium haloalkalitolerans]